MMPKMPRWSGQAWSAAHAYCLTRRKLTNDSQFVEQGCGLANEAGCSSPFSFSKQDLAKRFLDFANAPDDLVPGINYDEMACPKGRKHPKSARRRTAIVATMILHRSLETTTTITTISSHPRLPTISQRRRTSLIATRLAAMI
jgi:hypothetical protein